MAHTILELSQWACWPDAGGWADQDAALVDDITTYAKLKRRIEWEVENKVDGKGHQPLPEDIPKERFK